MAIAWQKTGLSAPQQPHGNSVFGRYPKTEKLLSSFTWRLRE